MSDTAESIPTQVSPAPPTSSNYEDSAPESGTAGFSLKERIAAALQKNLQTTEAAEDTGAPEAQGEPEKAAPAPKAEPTSSPADQKILMLEAQLKAQQDQFGQLMAHLQSQNAPPPPEPEPEPVKSWEPTDMLVSMAKAQLGEYATDRQIQEFVRGTKEAILHEAYTSNPDSPHYEAAKQRLDQFKTKAQKYDESNSLRAELAEVKKVLAEIQTQPKVQAKREEANQIIKSHFKNPQHEDFKNTYSDLLGVFAEHDILEDVTNLAIQGVSASPMDEGAYFQEVGTRMKAYNSKIPKAIAALKAAGPQAEVVLEALSVGEAPEFKQLLKKVVGSTSTSAPKAERRLIPPGPTQNTAPEAPPAEDEWEAFRHMSHKERVALALRKLKPV